jgi:hypothetical protein
MAFFVIPLPLLIEQPLFNNSTVFKPDLSVLINELANLLEPIIASSLEIEMVIGIVVICKLG